jgi:hypothetical protein
VRRAESPLHSKRLPLGDGGPGLEITPNEAFSMLYKWQVERTQVVLVRSLMPSHPLRGLVAVLTREGVWNSDDKPTSIWGFSLTGNQTHFLASAFEGFEYLQRTELPSEIRVSLQVTERDFPVLALTKVMKLPCLPRSEGDALVSVGETLFLVEDDALRST